MKLLRFLLSLSLTVLFIWSGNKRQEIGGNPVPPLGKFFDPFNGFWQNAESSTAYTDATLQLPSLKNDVQVSYDSILVPHVYAQNDYDAFLVQGYLTAKHRLWQMEMQTHLAAGRLTEIMGESLLKTDRYHRRIGLKRAAEIFINEIQKDKEVDSKLGAYVQGVNSYINSLTYREYPLEYKLLDYAPEEWTKLKSGLLLKYMANDLSGRNEDVEYTNAIQLFGSDLFALMYPERLEGEDPIVNKENRWEFDAVKIEKPQLGTLSEMPVLKEMDPKPNPDNGSNNWVVAGSKTASGNPILCNDPHLGLNLPSIWYAIHLNTPEMNVMGASLPGAPTVIIGFNEDIAWGVTNAQRDVQDWYKLIFDESNNSYLLDDEWVKAEMAVESFKVRGGADFIDTVYHTYWGPVVYDNSYGGDLDPHYYALKWVAHEPSQEIKALMNLNKAKSYDEYREAIKDFSSPGQNMIFASNTGDIGMTVQGRYPMKWQGQGKFVMDGTTKANDWQGFIPVEHNVFDKNPERGFVSSANQIPADYTYPYYIFDAVYEHYRNRRINQLLTEKSNITVSEMEEMLDDNFNLLASENLPFLLAQVKDKMNTESKKKFFKTLADWDFFNDADQVAPAYFEAWMDELYETIWDETTTDFMALKRPYKAVTHKLIMENPDFPLFDIAETDKVETMQDVLLISFENAVKKVKDWEGEEQNAVWKNYKSTQVKHLTRLAPFSVEVHNGGNHNIVNATSERHGPSWRMVVELDPSGTKGYFAYPGGQEGNPGSYYYDNMIRNWEACKLYPNTLISKEDPVMSKLTLKAE
ncbi:penicillin acylase family protein [Sediminitomix flava]|uniref:Penicillin amidase n=1 Tax=Sediminitomix flava TaxID=379075 RepID=A0A315Z771_SEDFL|nr:penicillin acylase family protein [Sediminitomix flava]PWJ39994.1 penicillin amidase [Sediminitomix flava]